MILKRLVRMSKKFQNCCVWLKHTILDTDKHNMMLKYTIWLFISNTNHQHNFKFTWFLNSVHCPVFQTKHSANQICYSVSTLKWWGTNSTGFHKAFFISSSSSSALQLFMSFGFLSYFVPLLPLLRSPFPVLHSHLSQIISQVVFPS